MRREVVSADARWVVDMAPIARRLGREERWTSALLDGADASGARPSFWA